MFSLSGKVAIITGGASGIGEATVRRFAAAGATCVIADVGDATALAEEVGGSSQVCDVTDATQVDALVASTVDHHAKLDIMVNNAGVLGPGGGVMADSIDDGRSVLEVNLFGVVNGIRAAAAVMEPGSAIVNTASMAGVVGFPGLGWYGMSKWGVVGLTKNTAIELGPRGIRVNCVCPTGVVTGMVPDGDLDHWASESMALANQHMRRLGTPDEVAAAIHFLASDDAMLVNGHALHTDGGLGAGMSNQLIEAAVDRTIADETGYIE